MRRFDYRVTASRRFTGIELPAALPVRYRRPSSALAGSIVVVGVICAVQAVRFVAADHQAAEYARRVVATDRGAVQIRSLAAEIARSRALVSQVDGVRHSGPARASELAMLGNSLPPDAWLTSIRVDRDTIAVAGRGARLASVGAALSALAAPPSYGEARLVDVRNDAHGAGVSYEMALEPAP